MFYDLRYPNNHYYPQSMIYLCRRFCLVWSTLLICLLFILSWGTSTAFCQDFLGKQKENAAKASLIGTWIAEIGKMKIVLNITDTNFSLNEAEGEYEIKGSNIKFQSGTTIITYQFDIQGNDLNLSGGDLDKTLKFSRQMEAMNFLRWIIDFSPESAKKKFYRIVLILGVVFISRFLIFILRAISRSIIFSNWGPLRFIYRYNKNRALTIYSVILNLLKYVIYFTAIGFILGEIGINYTAYLASLSVIGLAIGFGSQGLVQDMVTGFFVVFEGQFDVGDMVEISGQIGIIEELGLRMTKLRNYLGEIMFIPNRNIAMVGNFMKGAQMVHIDVATVNKEAAEQEGKPIKEICEEVTRQFEGVILSKPSVKGPLLLDTDEYFVRILLTIWPQQLWVIDQQLVPRIREVLTRKGFQVPGDRVVVFYHARKEATGFSLWPRHKKNIKIDHKKE